MATVSATGTPILTLRAAKNLTGTTISANYYGYAGQNGQMVFKVGSIISQYDFAKKMTDWAFSRFGSQAAYWEFYISKEDPEEKKNTLLLLDDRGENRSIICHPRYSFFFVEPTFTCSDADRPVFFKVLQ